MTQHTVEYEVAESKYKPDVALLDKYHGFSSEILRLALLILAAIGVLLRPNFLSSVKGSAMASLITAVVASGLSAAFALAHRYVSTEALAYELSYLRGVARSLESPNDGNLNFRQQHEHLWMIRLLKLSTKCLFVAVAGLTVGAIAIAVALIKALAAV
jgi:hypothetical protein